MDTAKSSLRSEPCFQSAVKPAGSCGAFTPHFSTVQPLPDGGHALHEGSSRALDAGQGLRGDSEEFQDQVVGPGAANKRKPKHGGLMPDGQSHAEFRRLIVPQTTAKVGPSAGT